MTRYISGFAPITVLWLSTMPCSLTQAGTASRTTRTNDFNSKAALKGGDGAPQLGGRAESSTSLPLPLLSSVQPCCWGQASVCGRFFLFFSS